MRYLGRVLFILALLLAAVLLAPIIVDDKGYVLIAMGNWTLESTVFASVFMLIVAFMVAYLAFKVLFVGTRSAGKVRNWLGGRSGRAKEAAFFNGLYALTLGNEDAAKQAFKKVKDTGYHGFHQVALGQLALQANDPDKANYWFEQAKHSGDKRCIRTTAVLMARFHLQNNEPEKALLCIDAYTDDKEADVLKIRAAALAKTQQWDTLSQQLPKWKKPLGAEFEQVTTDIAAVQFSEIASKQGANQLKLHWEQLPRHEKKNPAYQEAFFAQLISQGMHEVAQQYLVSWYKGRDLPSSLLKVVRKLRLPNPAPTVGLLESAIKRSPEDPSLYATLGHVAYYCNDMALSERALAKAITLNETKEDLMLLADIYEQKQAYNEAMQAMRRVANLTQ
ncbi:hypothetical protein DRW07_15890 [Alteromonas sediminis]|uniref:HemY N-terminal domain-containing protein n=1 Tax=Alteromonas sediminis TaxID=2259342 RepID=A0A3N5XY08_9ALTE|nr:heme biosynthesis HemY N-terminal domain-containing protein [Alteromonas sediminis]RPJ65383.1 hypothetical protein DRW07_15890 [Alteromonas sediminis]